MDIFILILLGVEFGSFANVCIYRWPRNQSVIKPSRSHCPWCGHKIAWWENIPVLSFLLLKRKCAHCDSRISWRYPFVEIALPLLWIISWALLKKGPYPLAPQFLFCVALFIFCLLVGTMSDLDWKIIPDEINLSLTIAAFLLAPWNPFFERISSSTYISAAQGAVFGASVLWIIGLGGKFLFGKEAMGGGDIKLMAGIGAFLGWQSVLVVLVFASFAGSVCVSLGFVFKKIKRQQYIPFGPFLSVAALLEFLLRARGGTGFDILMKIP